MAKKILVVNDYSFDWLLPKEGLSTSRNDVHSADSGELADGTLRIDRVIMRTTIDVSLSEVANMLTKAQVDEINKALYPQYLKVEYYDFAAREQREEWFYLAAGHPKITTVVSNDYEELYSIDDFQLIAIGKAGDGRAGYDETLEYLLEADRKISRILGK